VDKYGLVGAAWSNAFANWVLLVFLTAFALADHVYNKRFSVDPRPSTWPSPFSVDICCGLWPLLQLGLPSAFSLLIEWGSFEMNAAIVGNLGIEALAVHAVFVQYSAIFYALPNGLAQSAATLSSNALGAGRHALARRLVPLSYAACLVCGLFQASIMLSQRETMGRLFSSDDGVVRRAGDMAGVFAVYEMADVFKCAGMIYLRETGRPKLTFFAVAVAVAGSLPLAYWVGLHTPWGLPGIWLSMSSAWYLCGTVYLCVLALFTDWEDEARKALERGQGGDDGVVGKIGDVSPVLDEEGAPAVGLEMVISDTAKQQQESAPTMKSGGGQRQAKYSRLTQLVEDDLI
jgi:Na+-driven multidrug efflux pump